MGWFRPSASWRLPMEAERMYLPLSGGSLTVQCGHLRVGGMWAIGPFEEICQSPRCASGGGNIFGKVRWCLVPGVGAEHVSALSLAWECKGPGSRAGCCQDSSRTGHGLLLREPRLFQWDHTRSSPKQGEGSRGLRRVTARSASMGCT